MRSKHVRDYNQGRRGFVGGNPRFGKSRGNFKGQRAACRFDGDGVKSALLLEWEEIEAERREEAYWAMEFARDEMERRLDRMDEEEFARFCECDDPSNFE